jgi:biopolymer transport protein ExbD
MRLRPRSSRRLDAFIDITSLIDAAFILIIFLLISTTFKKKEHGFRIALPTAAHEELIVQTQQTSVYVTREGDIHFLEVPPGGSAEELAMRDSKPITLEELRSSLEKLAQDTPDASLSILAQKDTDYQHVVGVLSEVRAAGVRNVQLPYELARPAPPEPPPP